MTSRQCLVGGLEHYLFSIIYGMSSFPLTNSYVSRWLVKTTNQMCIRTAYPWLAYGKYGKYGKYGALGRNMACPFVGSLGTCLKRNDLGIFKIHPHGLYRHWMALVRHRKMGIVVLVEVSQLWSWMILGIVGVFGTAIFLELWLPMALLLPITHGCGCASILQTGLIFHP